MVLVHILEKIFLLKFFYFGISICREVLSTLTR